MIGRPKKNILASKFSAMNQTMASFKDKFHAVWLFVKQVWYIPFLWSLAWYSYWVFRSALVFNMPLLEINAMDYFGIVISMVALLIAGYRARKPIRKSLAMTTDIGANIKRAFSPENRPRGSSQIRFGSLKTVRDTEVQMQRQPKLENRPHLSAEIQVLHSKIISPKKPLLRASNAANFSNNFQPSRPHPSKDLSTECLTCAQLLNCTYRSKRVAELNSQGNSHSPCRFAKGLSEGIS
jgi:hypothetical protein